MAQGVLATKVERVSTVPILPGTDLLYDDEIL